MLKKTVTYTNFNGETKTKDLYFNIAKSELVSMVIAEGGTEKDLEAQIDKLVKEKNGAEIIRRMTDLIKLAYGERSEDGESFRKSKEISENFGHTAAFDELISDILLNPETAADFVTALLPADLAQKIKEQNSQRKIENGVPQDFRKKEGQ